MSKNDWGDEPEDDIKPGGPRDGNALAVQTFLLLKHL